MVKKNITLMASTAVALLALSQGTAFAATTPVDYNSNATLTLEASTDPTKPVDPTDPDPTDPVTPIDPTDPTKPITPGTDGPLSIDYASSLDFGTQKIVSSDQTYTAAPQEYKTASGVTTYGPNYVQVTDNTGSDQGWSLNVTQVGQMSDGSSPLNGASLSFTNGNVLTTASSDAGIPDTQGSLTLIPGVTAKVTTAEANKGQGTWVTRYGSASGTDKATVAAADSGKAISLFVPGAATKRAAVYTSVLKWNLSQTPSANTAIK